ncbi:MAG: DMT family transporter [Pseudomonadota bacterium]
MIRFAAISDLKLSNVARMSLLMLAANAAGASMTLTIRVLSDDLHAFELAFFRNLFAFLLIIPFIRPIRLSAFQARRPGTIFACSALHVFAMLSFFYAVGLMPLAELTALTFSKPLFVTVGAVIFLHEIVRARRWTAVAIGFFGVLIIIQPDGSAFNSAAILVIASTVAFSGISLMMKRLSGLENSTTIILYQNFFLTLLSLGPAIFVWRNPALQDWPLLILMGAQGIAAWICFIRAIKLADASAVAPFEFTKLPMIALFAYFMFGEVPSIWTWIGGVIISASTVYIAHREAVAARRAAAIAATPAPAAAE